MSSKAKLYKLSKPHNYIEPPPEKEEKEKPKKVIYSNWKPRKKT